jgi:hypothetical protein
MHSDLSHSRFLLSLFHIGTMLSESISVCTSLKQRGATIIIRLLLPIRPHSIGPHSSGRPNASPTTFLAALSNRHRTYSVRSFTTVLVIHWCLILRRLRRRSAGRDAGFLAPAVRLRARSFLLSDFLHSKGSTGKNIQR